MNDEELLKKQLEALISLAKSDSNTNETIVFEANPEILE